MATQVITQLDWKVLTDEVSDVMEFGIQKRWFFRIMEEKGVIDKQLEEPDWLFVPIESDSTTLPKEARERLEAVKAKFQIRQVIVGHEKVEAPVVEAPQIVETKHETKEPVIPWNGIATVAVTLVAGLAYVMISGMLMAFSTVDPVLVIVLNDPETTWISICEWLE
jgi:hypothetical protein